MPIDQIQKNGLPLEPCPPKLAIEIYIIHYTFIQDKYSMHIDGSRTSTEGFNID
jgi:hypothetical protein